MSLSALQKRLITAGVMLIVFFVFLFLLPKLYAFGFFSVVAATLFWEWLRLKKPNQSSWIAASYALLALVFLCALVWLFGWALGTPEVSELTQTLIEPSQGVSQTDVKTLDTSSMVWGVSQWGIFILSLLATLVWIVWVPIELVFLNASVLKKSEQKPQAVGDACCSTQGKNPCCSKTPCQTRSCAVCCCLLKILPVFLIFVFWLGTLYILNTYGAWYLISLWVFVWVADTGAYFGGRYLGGPKLAPRVSPGKTLSGALCGILSAVIWGVISYYIPGTFMGCFSHPVVLFGLGCVFAIVSILGDLYESNTKRVAGVKDSSCLLPGHGGVWDRLDSIIAVTPVALFILLWFV